MVLPSRQGTARSGRRPASQGAHGRRTASVDERYGAPSLAGAVRGAQELVLPAPSRQSGRARRQEARPAAIAVVFHAPPLSQGTWHREAATPAPPSARRPPPSRGPPLCSP